MSVGQRYQKWHISTTCTTIVTDDHVLKDKMMENNTSAVYLNECVIHVFPPIPFPASVNPHSRPTIITILHPGQKPKKLEMMGC